MFWDSSALAPYLIEEERSAEMVPLFVRDDAIIIWWGTQVECASALERRRREGLAADLFSAARQRLEEVIILAEQVPALDSVRASAIEILGRHNLRALDALQLAAAKLIADIVVDWGTSFVCLDDQLRDAARREGLVPVPE